MWRLLLWLRKNIKLLQQPVRDSHSEIIWINWLCQITDIRSDTNAPSSVPRPHRTHHSCRHGADTFIFSELPRNFAPCHSQEVRGETIAGEGHALQRCRPEVWTDVWVHCHSGMGAGPGAQLRGVALTCPPLSRPHALCVDTLNHGEGGLGGATV